MNKFILFAGSGASCYWAYIAIMDWFYPAVVLDINLGELSALLCFLTLANTISSSVIMSRQR